MTDNNNINNNNKKKTNTNTKPKLRRLTSLTKLQKNNCSGAYLKKMLSSKSYIKVN